MRVTQFYLCTTKEAPAEAELVSHRLMLRAGLIKRLAGGIYTWMPLGLRVVRKVERIVREEMTRAGALEILMPAVQPAELWQESGRWKLYGPELLRLRDRHEREFCIGPTHEEVVTDVVRRDIRSYRQLPLNLFQIQTKFRDEIRPRFGVMRGREFVMKDAYSFHATREDLEREYRRMHEAYSRIFSRLGLKFRSVAADTGSIGGTGSHEFQVLADSGEDAIAYCPDSDYAANLELAEALPPPGPRQGPKRRMEKAATPGASRCEDVAKFLGTALDRIVKTIAVMCGDEFALLLLRGDRSLNEVKVSRLLKPAGFRFAADHEVQEHLGCPPGYIGPVGAEAVRRIADREVSLMSDFVCGANAEGYHLQGVNWGRDLGEPDQTADIRNVVPGDPSPDGKGLLQIVRGIEVGHIFQLRTKYSREMNATFLDSSGQSQFFEMGCYGIGITRIVGAAIEQCHDERGIIFPESISPFDVAIVPIGYLRNERVREAADRLHQELEEAGFEVLLDDRDERPGIMFADMELVGIPYRVTVGERNLGKGLVECQRRCEGPPKLMPGSEVIRWLKGGGE